ncbi:sugar ABC transporter ATP-binding protein [Neorhodopirellula pilleata]|uniref:Ribose import ATP-binding protein RbsA n=1 Tax=Neorhodopirellula pilleata TaxID=2714738 RepID=A0A5C6APK0_9BACT|nr:sugar ABC transporter ATP-binding protein [Neorhodopirellula pilleata]TWU01361.1 Ribose import ATP-binding protein RbsA [Neorhodopirellula pilleata]
MPPLLRTNRLTKRYGDVTVLRDVSLDVRAGEIHALLGANGAGKSTLCRIISGLVTPSDGTMDLNGESFSPQHKQDAESRGVEIIQQELNLVSTLSVAENLFLTRLPNRWGWLRTSDLHRRARDVLDRFGLSDVPTDVAVGSLGVGRQQMVEIAASLARDCKLLILDEPTAALSATESQNLFQHLSDLRDSGVAMIYISHRLDEVAVISDRITVLRDGRHVDTRSSDSLTTDEMVDLMSGQVNASARLQHIDHRTDEVAMRVESLSRGIVKDVSFEVHRGERLGICGLVGSGRTELLRAMFGADPGVAGTVWLQRDQVHHRFSHPADAVAAGLAMVTEDRKDNGLLLTQSIRANVTLASLRARFTTAGWLKRREERVQTETMKESLEIRCESIEQPVKTLSGGNQQKVAVAKWLVRDADVFLFDEPTRGIDVAARRRIYRLFESLSADGKAIVIVSSDLEELFETCDRIAVMSAGRLVKTFERNNHESSSQDLSPWDFDDIMQASFSGYMQ